MQRSGGPGQGRLARSSEPRDGALHQPQAHGAAATGGGAGGGTACHGKGPEEGAVPGLRVLKSGNKSYDRVVQVFRRIAPLIFGRTVRASATAAYMAVLAAHHDSRLLACFLVA